MRNMECQVEQGQALPVSPKQVMMDLEWSNLQNKIVNTNPEKFRLPMGEKKSCTWWAVTSGIFLLIIAKAVVIICIYEGIITV